MADEAAIKALAAAVIEYGIRDAYAPLEYTPDWKRHQRQALNWIFGGSSYAGSFAAWCYAAGLDPDVLRERLAREGGDIAKRLRTMNRRGPK